VSAGFEDEELVLEKLEDAGFDRDDLPGPGDLHDAIWEAGFELKPQETTD
jgi:hypothetical protein